MTKIVQTALGRDEKVKSAATSYIDDIFVDESKVGVDKVVCQLKEFGLVTKPAERLGSESGVRVLGLRVDKNLRWKRDSPLPVLSNEVLTRRQVHKVLGEWLGHFPVCGWLRVVCGFLQRVTAEEGIDWDDKVSEATMGKVLQVGERLKAGEDPVKGRWLAPEKGSVVVWTDASSLALGVVITIDSEVVEDAAWLRKKNDTKHINISELEAAIRGVNMALKWKAKAFVLKTDSTTVSGWLRSAFSDTHNVHTHALSELLIRRRLDILRQLRIQEDLKVEVQLVRSEENISDKLTRVPKGWLNSKEISACPARIVNDQSMDTAIMEMHRQHHLGVQRTYSLAKLKFGDGITKDRVATLLSDCDECSRICPAVNPHYRKGFLSANDVWQKVSSDVTHVGRKVYLTLIDMGTRFCLWRLLVHETAREICVHINQIFSEFGPPKVFFSDNGTVYRSHDVQQLMHRWNVTQEFSCAYRPQGNGISERNHRTIKTMAARSNNTIEQCVFWFNATSSFGKVPPYTLMFHSRTRLPDVCEGRRMMCEQVNQWKEHAEEHSISEETDANPFVVGDMVYLRNDGRCDSEWTGPHRVTSIKSAVSVEVNNDGIVRHVTHLRRIPIRRRDTGFRDIDSDSSDDESEENAVTHVEDGDLLPNENERTESEAATLPRRCLRDRQRPTYLLDYAT